jgi:hypothetical protein
VAVVLAMFFGLAVLVLRWGLIALATTQFFSGLLGVPAAQSSAWYVGGSMFLLGLALAIATWAFYTSLGGRKLWKTDLFG